MEQINIILTVFVQIIPSTILMIVPFRKRLRFSPIFTGCCIVIIYMVIVLSSMWFMNRFVGTQVRIIFSITCMILVCVMYMIGYDLQKSQVVFVLMIIKNYMDAANLFAKTLTEYHCRNYTFIQQNSENFYESFSLLAQAGVVIVTFPLMWIFVTKLLYLLTDETMGFRFWRYLWIIPSAFYLTYRLGIAPGYCGEVIVWSTNYIFLPYAWAVGTFLTYGTIMFVLMQMVQAAQLEEKLHISKMQLQMQAEQYRVLRQNIEQTRRERHDLRHHLIAIKGYAEARDCDGMDCYLEKYMNTISEEEQLNVCENYAINSIVSHYLGLATKNQIKASATVKLPDPLPVTESDLCIVLGNLIENAYEACLAQTADERFISVKIGISGAQMIAISVKNSYSGEIIVHDKKFISLKRSSEHEMEGIGISSVRSITEKYNGMCNFTYDKGIFHSTVLLNP